MARMEPSKYFQSFLSDYLDGDPELLTAFGLSGSNGHSATGGMLSECTDQFVLERVSKARSCLDVISGFDGTRMSDDESVSRRVLSWYLRSIVEAESHIPQSYPIHSRGGLSDLFVSGVSQQLPLLLIHGHSLFTRQDAFDYVSRLHAVPLKFEQVQLLLRERHARGLDTPALVLRRALQAMEAHVATPPQHHPLLENYREKLGVIRDLDEGERVSMLRMAASAIVESVYPAYGRLIETCKALLRDAPESCSLQLRPGGADYYRYLLKKFTTSDDAPEAMHAWARDEVMRVRDEMRVRLGRDDISRPDGGHADTTDHALLMRAQQCITDATAYLEDIVPRVPDKPVRVEPMIASMQPFAGQGYYEQPSCLTGGYGVFRLNPSQCRDEAFTLKTLTVHETVPGHHLQSVYLYGRSPALPAFRLALPFRGYTEGWAVYAERLVSELGFYEDDPVGELGRLATDLRRSARLLIDTGIHGYGWSMRDARETLRTMIGDASWLDEEIERVCIQPAEGAAYKVGERALLRVRDRARRAWGASFDPRQFHHRILELGPCPLAMLEEIVVGIGGNDEADHRAA
jgi:uncharacterized protein (DUF885 family)